MNRVWRQWLAGGVLCCLAGQALAAGSGLNVIVVVNKNSTNSVQLGNYYCEKRQVPPQNYLRISWPGWNIDWTNSDFQTYLYNPLIAMVAARGLTNQADYVVLCMDIPYRVFQASNYPNSTASALFYGFKPDANPYYPDTLVCSMAPGSTNLYAGSEGIFRSTPPSGIGSNSFLVTMITASNLAAAKMIVDQGVASDGTYPTQMVTLAKSDDWDRNVRYILFDNAIFNTRLRGNYAMQRINTYTPVGLGDMLGYQNGVVLYRVAPADFVPGGIADNLTSYCGAIFEDTGQTTLLPFLSAGACASYGTVTEPCNYLEKFPSPQNYFYQSRGFTVAECYYQSLTNPYQGMVVGEPLAAPFARPASGSWNNLPTNSVLSGITNLSLQFTATDALHPVQQVDLFLDGLFLQTLTNIPPTRGNMLTVTINGVPITYSVTSGATTIKAVATGLTAAINSVVNTNATKVLAYEHGDRVELRSFDQTKTGAQVSVSVSSGIGTGTVQTTWIADSRTNCLDTIANGIRSYLIAGNPVGDDFLQLVVTKTNGTQITFGVTNTSGLTLTQLTQDLLDLVNTNSNPSLQGPDGLSADDFGTDWPGPTPPEQVEFNLRARSPGWNTAQIQAAVSGSAVFTISPSGANHLDGNLADLEPRGHLYITAGFTNLPVSLALHTTNLADGYHDLTAVAYEGSHVRTQCRATQNVRIANSALSATFTILAGGPYTDVASTMQFSVVANTNNISKIELFSTGGSLGSVSSQSSAIFSIPGATLGLGLHPVYALVTASNAKQYRTETKWIRLVGPEPPFSATVNRGPILSWSATAGRSYDILSVTNLTNSFQIRATLLPTNGTAQWAETNSSASQRFYRVRTSN